MRMMSHLVGGKKKTGKKVGSWDERGEFLSGLFGQKKKTMKVMIETERERLYVCPALT